MAIMYANDGIYEIVEPRLFHLSARSLMIVMLIIDILSMFVFWISTNEHLTYFFCIMGLLNFPFLAGYFKENFNIIFVHLVFTVGYTFFVAIFFVFVELNMKVCNEYSRCQRMSELFETYGIKINSNWFYSYVFIITASHCLMIFLSFKLMRYTAAKTELKRLSNIAARGHTELHSL